jgi:hypothetical protein
MNLLQQILAQYPQVLPLVKQFEAGSDPASPARVSKFARHPDWIRWFWARRLVSFLQWDVYGAAAIAHYQRTAGPTAPPRLNELGACFGAFAPADAEELEAAYFACEEAPWRDERPDGYSYDPFVDEAGAAQRDVFAMHRRMTQGFADTLTRILQGMAGEIEAICGHYWTPSAARLYSHGFFDSMGGYHSDRWPPAIKKIMIYPSGASLEKGTTEMELRNGERRIVDGPKGCWIVFENSTLNHRAFVPNRNGPPRPTIELSILPSFATDPTVRLSGLHVGYPWLPPETTSLPQDISPARFSGPELEARVLTTTLLMGIVMPEKVNIPDQLRGIGLHDVL